MRSAVGVAVAAPAGRDAEAAALAPELAGAATRVPCCGHTGEGLQHRRLQGPAISTPTLTAVELVGGVLAVHAPVAPPRGRHAASSVSALELFRRQALSAYTLHQLSPWATRTLIKIYYNDILITNIALTNINNILLIKIKRDVLTFNWY